MRFSTTDIAVTGATTLAVAGLLWLFAADIMQASSRDNAVPLGTVVFKRLSATRRAADQLSWERMRNNSPVWELDTLRTADFSEAKVTFDDGTELGIQENSMLRLNFGRDVRNLEFLSGEITLGGARRSDWKISSDAGSISLGENSRATFSRNEDALSVEVESGEATLVRSDGSTVDVAVNEELEVNVKTGATRILARPIVAIAPARNARMLWLEEGADAAMAIPGGRADARPLNVSFAWRSDGVGAGASSASGDVIEDSAYILELCPTASFVEGVVVHEVSGLQALVPVVPGTWFWRIRGAEGAVSTERRFTISRDEHPRPIAPLDGTLLRFRRIKPSLRFSWAALEAANSWLFELSQDPDFATTRLRTRVLSTSITVPGLDEGQWYWRVSPVHEWAVVSPPIEREIRRFTVERSPEMQETVLSNPFNKTLFQIQELDSRGLAFSWVPVDEALSYELVVSAQPDMSQPILSLPIQTAYLRLEGEVAAPLATPGTFYWGVRWLDAEGNRSPVRDPRLIEGVDGMLAIRPSFPPDGYRIADSLAANTRFTWKSNLAAKTVFQVARSADFSDLLYEEAVQTETTFAKNWPVGEYWWRLRTYNADGSVFIDTPVRSFSIVEPLAPPLLESPASNTLFYLREGDERSFSWIPVPRADYYSLSISGPHDNYAKPIFEKGITSDTFISFDLGNWPSGDYRFSVQAHSLEHAGGTRIIGYIGGGILHYENLQYIKLGAPEDGSSLEGLSARRRGVPFSLLMNPPPDEGELLVSPDASFNKPLYRIPLRNVGDALRSGRLDPGTWWWRVSGSKAGFDISSQEALRFTVLPIPPLPRARLDLPADGAVVDADWLRTRRTISFEWGAVPFANEYILGLYRNSSASSPLARFELKAITNWTLEDLSILDRGDFVWTLEARSRDRNGEIEQYGLVAERRFSIELPPARDQNKSGSGALYGR